MVAVGDWMRNKETQEVVRVKKVGAMIHYSNAEVDGEVQSARLAEHFDVLDDPTTREDIEALLKAKVEADEAETGLYSTSLAYVVVDRVDDVVTFQWFDDAMPFSDVIHGND